MTDARQIAREIVPERDLVTLLNEDLVLAARLLAYLRPRIAAALTHAEGLAEALEGWEQEFQGHTEGRYVGLLAKTRAALTTWRAARGGGG